MAITYSDPALDSDLTAVGDLSGTGLIARTGTGTASVRTITAGTGVTVTDGDGVSGNPTVSLDADLTSWASVTRATGFDTFTATPTSANLAALVTDETGTGALVFAGSPTLTGTPAAPTATPGTNTTQIATTAFVADAIATGGGSFQPLDSDLTSWAGVTRAAGFDTFAATPSSANLASLVSDETGSGLLVFATSPTLTTPLLGTPTSGNLSNCTAYPTASLSGLGTGVAAALAINVGSAGAPVVLNGALGTPSSGTLTSATGLPISTGVSGLGTGVADFLATPSSANLKTAVTDETGSGSLVFATSPTLVTPVLGVASATSINKVALTAPATGSTLTIADGKTLTASNTLTLTATDGSTLAIGAGGTLASAAYKATGTSGNTVPLLDGTNTFSGAMTLSNSLSMSSNGPIFAINTTSTGFSYLKFQESAVDKMSFFYEPASEKLVVSDGADMMTFLKGGGVTVGTPSGGDRGAGSLNAVAVYDDNTLLTCYIVEAWKYGSIDLAKWDALTPNREYPATYETVETGGVDADDKPVTEQRVVTEAYTEVREHAPARGFARVAADRLDIDKFSQFVWDNERLPAFPAPDRWSDMYSGKMATGDLIQRLWETVEVMAVHSIEARKRELALVARIEALEAAQ